MWGLYVAVAALLVQAGGAGVARLVCYVESPPAQGLAECTHVVYVGGVRGDKLDAVLKEVRKGSARAKIVVRVDGDDDKEYRTLLKSKYVQGLEVDNAHRTLNRTKVTETVEAARVALNAAGGGPLLLALPAHPELLAKYYDLRVLVKKADLMMVQTHALGKVKRMTYHPSRLSGLWDMMNTDSVVDLVVGLGVPASKIVISLPATAQRFTLQNETLSTPGSPTTEDEPKEIGQAELCRLLQKGRWTLERDQDLSAPYAFQDKTWIAFEDSSSVDVKGKYARVRGLAGLALHRAERDEDTPCGAMLRAALAKVLNQQSRAPRAVILRSLEQEILSAPGHGRALDALQVSPYRITQVVDSDGVIHSIREDTRTEFSCSRQGYFVHPRSCARFYRCVKFDQLSPEYTVFEFDCPAGLAFDSRYEVCVWPGSLAHSQACPGSSEIAPVPRTRFTCPEHEGYYADPENCRWFFACLDHGKAPLTAYEFRCPFGLGFDAARLKCDWPWLVPACGNIARYEAEVHGYSGALLTGAAGFQGKTADSINIEGHQSLVSGASLDNLVGIQGGFLTKADSLDSNFIASQELAGSGAGGVGLASGVENVGLVQPTSYNKEPKYTSGSLILDDYRLPTKKAQGNARIIGIAQDNAQAGYSNAYSTANLGQAGVNTYSTVNLGQTAGLNTYSTANVVQAGGAYSAANLGQANGYSRATFTKQSSAYQSSDYDADNSGAYVHDPSGDYAEPYKHIDSPVEPYLHQDSAYKHSSDYYDYGRYKGSGKSGSSSQYVEDNSGQYVHDYTGDYVQSGYKGNSNAYRAGYSGSYNADYSGAYTQDNSGQYVAGVYRSDGHIGNGGRTSSVNGQSYSQANAGNYIQDFKAYTGASHTLTAGAVNVGLVGKTTLVDADYTNQFNYQRSQGVSHQTLHPGHVTLVSQPAVSISHVGTDENNLDGYGYVTTPTTSGIPTTATPFAVTTALPAVTYKTAFVPEPPKSTVKQIFGYSQPQITTVRPALVAVKQEYFTPQYKVSGNQGLNYQYESKDYSSAKSQSQSTIVKESSGYDYSKPSIKFEDGVSYTTAAPAVVSTYEPAGFSHSQQTHHVNSVGYQYSTPVPVTEEPFKKLVAYTTGSPVTFAQPTASSYPQAYSHQTIHKVEANNVQIPSVSHEVRYEQPQIVQYTTPQPTLAVQPIVSTYQPQVISQQTIHKVGGSNVQIPSVSHGVRYEQPQVVQYTTAQPALAVQPVVSTYQPQVISQQTLHKVDASRINTYAQDTSSGYKYEKPAVKFEEGIKTVQYITPAPTIVQYSTPAPVVSTYRPEAYSHQVLHKFESQPQVIASTPAPIQYELRPSPVTVYKNPILKYTEPKVTPVTYAKPAYNSQAYSHQTIHKFNTYTPSVETGYDYSKSTFSYEQPKVVHYTTSQPAIAVQPVVSTYQPQVVSHQTYHKVDAGQVKTYSEAESGYQYSKPSVKFEYEAPKNVETYKAPEYIPPKTSYQQSYSVASTAAPAVLQTVQTYSTPAPVVSTYQPQTYSHQTLHKVESQKFIPVPSTTPKFDTYQTADVSESGYEYSQPSVKFVDVPQTVQTYSTPAPVVVSTYRPQIYSHQTLHKVETQKFAPEVSKYENPILTYAKKITPVTYVKSTPASFTQTFQPIIQQHEVRHEQANYYDGAKQSYEQNVQLNQGYSYSQPEIQTNSEISGQTYSDASVVSHQTFNLDTNSGSRKNVEFISTTPATLAYEEHYSKYEAPKKIENYKAPEYIPPKTEYQQSYSVVSTAAPAVQQTLVSSDQYDVRPLEYSQQYDTAQNTAQQVSFSTSHVTLPRVESVHRSTFPGVKVTTKYKPTTYDNPEIQIQYKAEEYLPPVVSTVAPVVTTTYKPVVTTTYKPRTYSTTTKQYLPPTTTREYLPPVEPKYKPREYLPPVTSSYLPPSTTARPVVKSTTFKASEYLPPIQDQKPNVVSFESFGYNFGSTPEPQLNYNPYQEELAVKPIQRKPNIVVETAKNLLGFGTVGPDAGLVSPVTYTTSTPVISSTTYRPIVKSTTPTYKYVESTTAYKAPEYLPPSEETKLDIGDYGIKSTERGNIKYNLRENVVVSSTVPVQRKQNIVVQTAKANLLGFGTVGPDAGLVSPVTYSSSTPVVFSSTESYTAAPQVVTSTYTPVEQGHYEVTPRRRTKPKVAVVTKINDFNPLLVRKLGAVCSCQSQSPVLVLKGTKSNNSPKDFDDYGNDYGESGRGDISDYEWAQKSAKLNSAQAITSTINPIIVPDDSYYQDYQEQGYDVDVTPKQEVYVSSTPVTSTEKVVRIRPRVKAVTVAPTYRTVLLKQEVAPTPSSNEAETSVVDSQSFDRYGPGGWRSRDETLQGSVDCKRAGLFRHPKQCNKFYACRWDCTKQRFTLHVFNCPVQLSFDPSIGACNWPSQGPACQGDTLLTNTL